MQNKTLSYFFPLSDIIKFHFENNACLTIMDHQEENSQNFWKWKVKVCDNLWVNGTTWIIEHKKS